MPREAAAITSPAAVGDGGLVWPERTAGLGFVFPDSMATLCGLDRIVTKLGLTIGRMRVQSQWTGPGYLGHTDRS
jgi:hypothetical protein